MRLLLSTAKVLVLMCSCIGLLNAQDLETVRPDWLDSQVSESTVQKYSSQNLSANDIKPFSWTLLKQNPTSTPQNSANPTPYVFPSADKRLHRYVMNTVGPLSLLESAAAAGLNQWDNDPPEWGQGAEGYGKRLASSIGSDAIRQSVSYGLSEALHLDATEFEKSKRKGFWPRVSDALVQNVTSRTRSGKRVISAPIFAGAYAGSVIPALTWYPSRYSYKDGLRHGSFSLAAGFGINLVREFIFNW